MTSTQIQCFLAAAQANSFTEAAEHLFMTQPTFGRQISALEKELGFSLFVRGWKPCQLTSAGQTFYTGLSKLTEEFAQLLEQAQGIATGKKGQLSIGFLEGQLLDDRLSMIIGRFREQYTGIELKLSRYAFHEMLNSIRLGTLDVGITLTLDAASKPELSCGPIYRLKNELVFKKTHPLAGRKNLTLKDFSNETFIDVERTESDVISELMLQSCREAGFIPNTIPVSDLKAQILAVESGEGIAAFNQYHQTYNHPELVHIPLKELPEVEFCAAWLTDTPNPAVGLFISLWTDLVQKD